MANVKFCYDKIFKTQTKNGFTLKAVWQKSKYWNKGQTIRVFMINGTNDEQIEMKNAFSEISAHTGLTFLYTTDRLQSDIRVSFNKGWGSYSYLGTDALFIPKNIETINIGWRGMDVCRHEALHAIGALHEHQNPNEGIQWNEAEVIKDLSGPPNYWTIDEIRYNVLDKIDKTLVDTTAYDPESIMLYYFPMSWTINGVSSNDNLDFSKTDIEFMKKVYNVTPQDIVAPKLTLIGEEYSIMPFNTKYVELGATAIDNVDGDITSKIIIDNKVDTSVEGLSYVIYNVMDKAGNKSQKIRTIMTQGIFEIKSFIKDLYPTKKHLARLTENQLIVIGERIGITATVEDLKKDTVDRIWSVIQ